MFCLENIKSQFIPYVFYPVSLLFFEEKQDIITDDLNYLSLIFLLFSIGEIIFRSIERKIIDIIWHEYVCAVISWQTIKYSLY